MMIYGVFSLVGCKFDHLSLKFLFLSLSLSLLHIVSKGIKTKSRGSIVALDFDGCNYSIYASSVTYTCFIIMVFEISINHEF